MTLRRAQTVIQAAPGDVFSEVPATWLSIMEQVSPGPVALGTRFAFRSKRIDYWDVIDYSPPSGFALAHHAREGSPPMVFRYAITAVPNGTQVRVEAGIRHSVLFVIFKMGLFAPFVFGLEIAQLRKLDVVEMLADLKLRAEAVA